MLERLYIKNVALIEQADVEFDSKLNVLSGETGSGKSVILDSINFV
ncbi:MAG: AAA family ATPase, partial [Clostridia bacterium]|nr:AAA family ATPase [Clostridia bacterium]